MNLHFFPVRHHSPTAARLVKEQILALRPAAVLVEGPWDYNEQLDELYLPHTLPIAIYSYLQRPDGRRQGAFYPFCVYSPEWQALLAAREVEAQAAFIDLPLADSPEDRVNRYSDGPLAGSAYLEALCRELRVEDFSDLWDTLVELDTTLTPASYCERVETLCGALRELDGPGSESDGLRERFMAAQIQEWRARVEGPLIVVTGGYHTPALRQLSTGPVCPPPPTTDAPERGLALTPYAYERLDRLTGYEAGMPNPGFYDRLWHDRAAGRAGTHRAMLAQVVRSLRARKQSVSSADLIAVETCATGLARLRGHREVWRSDLVDGILGALVKDELALGGRHPMLDAVHEALRGGARGRLAPGARVPPLVADLHAQLAGHELEPTHSERSVEFELPDPRSPLLHRLRLLGIDGFVRTDGTDFGTRQDLSRLWEGWRLRWTDGFEASAVEAARYGPSLAEAAAERLAEEARACERDAAAGAALLLAACQADLQAGALHEQVRRLVRQDGDFERVTQALSHLLYLFHYDEVLGSRGNLGVGQLLQEAYARGLWLLETGGGSLPGLELLVSTALRCHLDYGELAQVLARALEDRALLPALRGAAAGGLWRLGAADAGLVLATLAGFTEPDRLGDFLTGLFCLARELVQRDDTLLLALDRVLTAYAPDSFVRALPALRLAFTYFTPREKAHLALALREALGDEPPAPPPVARDRSALEARVLEAARRYGVRS